MNNNNNVSWIQIMSADTIVSIRGLFVEYKGDELNAILEYLTVPPQEGESLRIPILRDGEYTIKALTTVVNGCEYNPDIDDLDEIIEEIIISKRFVVSNERLYRNDKLAVIISPKYGMGWYTWLQEPLLLTHPLLVERLENKLPLSIKWIKETLNIDLSTYYEDDIPNFNSLEIRWVPKGCTFKIKEYDGAESIEYFNPADYILA